MEIYFLYYLLDQGGEWIFDIDSEEILNILECVIRIISDSAKPYNIPMKLEIKMFYVEFKLLFLKSN